MNLVREHIIFEKFVEDSDPVHDMGIGGISFKEKRKELISSGETPNLDKWIDFLNSLIGKKITGRFLHSNKIKTITVVDADSYNDGKKVFISNIKGERYNIISTEKYIIHK
jgi:hypothetical protein